MATAGPKYKKAPDAPKRFKSAFIIFSAEKHKEIKEELAKKGRSEKTTDIAKLVSEAWREMSAEDKEVWEMKARKDKARYEVEKAMYKGPWKVQANKRTPKDPAAPKRPMSAFLAFSNKRRAALKREHPDATNSDLSKMLSVSWKDAPADVRKKYMDEEAALRANYKNEMGKWRKRVAEEKKVERQEREAIAMEAAESGQMPPEPAPAVAPSPPAPAPEPPRRYGKSNSSASASASHGASHHSSEPPPSYHHHPPPPPPMDQSLGPPMGHSMPPGPGSMYGNPYGGGGPDYGYGGMPPNPGPGGYPPMMGGQHYGGQPYMGGHSQQPYMPHMFNHQYKPSSHGGQRGMYGQGGPGPAMQGGQHGYGGYGGMGEMSPHPPPPPPHPSHMSGHGGYRPDMGHSGMHDMMGHHRDPYGHHGKGIKGEDHYGHC